MWGKPRTLTIISIINLQHEEEIEKKGYLIKTMKVLPQERRYWISLILQHSMKRKSTLAPQIIEIDRHSKINTVDGNEMTMHHMTHGALTSLALHGMLLSRMGAVQQSEPPGKYAQPLPPQEPQLWAQHAPLVL